VLDFDLPVTDFPLAQSRFTPRESDNAEPEILTEPEMLRHKYENLLAALPKTNWKIKGADGAAELLGVKADHPAYPDEKDEAKATRLISASGNLNVINES